MQKRGQHQLLFMFAFFCVPNTIGLNIGPPPPPPTPSSRYFQSDFKGKVQNIRKRKLNLNFRVFLMLKIPYDNIVLSYSTFLYSIDLLIPALLRFLFVYNYCEFSKLRIRIWTIFKSWIRIRTKTVWNCKTGFPMMYR
jgi:hypothetical protein